MTDSTEELCIFVVFFENSEYFMVFEFNLEKLVIINQSV